MSVGPFNKIFKMLYGAVSKFKGTFFRNLSITDYGFAYSDLRILHLQKSLEKLSTTIMLPMFIRARQENNFFLNKIKCSLERRPVIGLSSGIIGVACYGQY